MTQLSDRLQLALGDAYRIERELGGGGMSRLFVATERSLNRQVVVKVLPPDLTSEVSAARFKQEIEVAARLQHPHIVSILAAGSSGGLLYYIMPYVRGESLRQRLAGGKLPLRDAIRILDDLAGSLGYAHRQGIIHRDIKPENVLLEDGQAVLADFGVARAIAVARIENATGDRSLTATGTSVGTPRYMSPEQAAGESEVDARADVYALGLIGYEMLAGEHPFAATSAQKMIVAHLTSPAPSVSKLRPDTPIAVGAAIARALEKEPDARFRTADDFRAALEGAAPFPKHARSSLRYLAAGCLLVALATAGVIVARRRHAPPLGANLLAVAPFEVVDPELKLWHEGMVDVLSRNFDGAGPLRTVSPTLVIRQWSGHADKESARALGDGTGARLAVFGTVLRSGVDSVRATASVIDVQTGQLLGEVQAHDAQSHMDRLADSLTVGLLRALGKTRSLNGVVLSSVGTTSLPALKAFLQGEQYFRRSSYDSAKTNFADAIALDSGFSIALERQGNTLGLVSSAYDSGAMSYYIRAARFNHGLAARDSFVVVARSLFGALGTMDPGPTFRETQRAALTTTHQAVLQYPDDPEIWATFGDIQFHYAWGRGLGVSQAEIERSLDRAIELDSGYTPAYTHAIGLAFRHGTAKARRYMAAYLSQRPTGVEADAIKLAYVITDSDSFSTAQKKQAIDHASTIVLIRAANELGQLADSAEAETLIRRTLFARSVRGERGLDSADARFALASSIAARGHGAHALELFPHTFFASRLALLGDAPPKVVDSLYNAQQGEGCYACTINVYGLRGDTSSMLAALHSMDATLRNESAPPWRRIALGHTASVFIALARHDTAAALRESLAIPADSGCASGCAWILLTRARVLEARGQFADAAEALDEAGIQWGEILGPLFEFERARVAERLNDRAVAREDYAHVADMWQNGDAAFQVYAKAAREGANRER